MHGCGRLRELASRGERGRLVLEASSIEVRELFPVILLVVLGVVVV